MPADGPITVLAVDDQEVFRRAASELIAAADGFQQIAEAASGPEAIDLAAALRPALILLDLRMPGMDGLETARRLAAVVPDSTVVLMSLAEAPDLALRLGGSGLAHVRKQDLSVRTLNALWRRHGHRHATA